MLDDDRPTLALTHPRPGANETLGRIVVGFHDYSTGIEPGSFRVTADFPIDGVAAGEDLASRFRRRSQGVREMKLRETIARLAEGRLVVSVRDRQGNVTTIERTFSVGER